MLFKLEKSSVQGVTTVCRLEVLGVIKELQVFEVDNGLKEEALKKLEHMKEQHSGCNVSFNYWICQKIKSSSHLIIYCANNPRVLFCARA